MQKQWSPEKFDSELKNAVWLYETQLCSVTAETRLVRLATQDECDGIDGGVGVKAEALEHDLYEQSVQMKI